MSVRGRDVKGNVEANGVVTLSAIGGANFTAKTTSGGIRLMCAMNEAGKYTLKSLSGSAGMSVESEAPGFNATLSSHSGSIETDFPLTVGATPVLPNPGNRRPVGRYGKRDEIPDQYGQRSYYNSRNKVEVEIFLECQPAQRLVG